MTSEVERLKYQEVLLYPLMTEKSVDLIEKNRTITFIVKREATKPLIKAAVQALYGVKVEKVNTCITSDGRKKAYVKLKTAEDAVNLATRLGLL